MLKVIVTAALLLAEAAAPHFDSNRAWEHLRQIVAIGPRPAGSPAIEQTRKYIKDQLAAVGLTAVEQAWDDETPLGRVHHGEPDRDDSGRDARIASSSPDTTTRSSFASSASSAPATAARAPRS